MVNTNLATFRPNTNKEKFSFTGSGQATVQRTNDVSQATKIETVTGETLTLSSGAAGTTGKVSTTYGPITDSLGRKLGYFNTSTDSDTSVSITHLALAGNEVRFEEYLNETEIYALLDNGDYTVDYTNSIIYYKKGTSDTVGTINYKYTTPKLDASGAGASSVSAEYISPSDFTATYTSSSTLTLSALPISISDSSQVVYIKQIKSDNTSRTYVNGANDITLSISSNVVTLYEKGVALISLDSGDVYEVGINGVKKAYDISTNSQMNSILNQEYTRYTDAETLVSAQDLTDAYADFGAEIDMRGYNRLGVYVVSDVNDSENVTLQVLGKHTSEGTDEYVIDGIPEETLWTTSASDEKLYYEFDIGTIPFIQLQAKAETVGSTAGDLSIVIEKKWRN